MVVKYTKLAERLREELYKKGGQGGFKLPTEEELAQQYQVSRQTVRHALRLGRQLRRRISIGPTSHRQRAPKHWRHF